MPPRRVHIRGERGRWIAEVEGRWLAVIHTTWRVGNTGYHDPMRGVNADGRRYTEFIDALRREALVVVQKDKERENDREPLARAGYVGVFRFKDLEIGNDNSVKLTLIQRYADPSRP